MNRPYVFCHMLMSLDGKIMGRYMESPDCEEANKVFDEVAFGPNRHYQHQGWLCGRTTTEDNYTFYKTPQLDENAPTVPEGNFVADPDAKLHYISLDRKGVVAWEDNYTGYADDKAHIVEVLTEQASNAYKAFLRQKGISYIIAGKEQIDLPQMLSVLKDDFGIEMLMLGGGGAINWSFLQAGLCDELSVVMAPVADGSTKTQTLFQAIEGYSVDNPVSFKLKHADVRPEGTLWLRYEVKNAVK